MSFSDLAFRRPSSDLCPASKSLVMARETDPETHEVECRSCGKTVPTGACTGPAVAHIRMIEVHEP
jgi:hypothetical protein